MLAAYRKAFAKVAQDLELVREDQLAPYLGAREDQPLDQRLVADGLLRALDVERIYLELARRLDQRDPARLARRADETLVQLLGEERTLDPAELARLEREHQRATRPDAHVPFLAFLAERGALGPEQRGQVRTRLEATYVACPVCGAHTRRAPVSPTRCPECGMPLAAVPVDDDPLIGRVLGNCKLVRKIGQGGMGAVYLARHEILESDVAVKILPPHIAGRPEQRERFEREARLAAQLKHPGVVQVLDLGCEGGIHYIAMEFVPGESVAKRVDRAPLPVDLAVRIARDVAHALAHAHEAGLVHRDIKPDNILLAPNGRVVVADFGLARAVEGTPLSMTGQVLGTPAYMSPEQAKGETVDARSDVYSLGITLYAMLLGRSPFEKGSPMATLLAVCDEPIPPLGRVVEHVPLSLQGLVGQMGAKKPGLRPQTMTDVVRQLDRVAAELEGRPLPPPAKSTRPVSAQAVARPASGPAAVRSGPARPASARAGARPQSARAGALTPRPFPAGPVVAAAVLVLVVFAWAMWPSGDATSDVRPRETVAAPSVPVPAPVIPAPPRPATIPERIAQLEQTELAKRAALSAQLDYLDGLLDGPGSDPAYTRALAALRTRVLERARAEAVASLEGAIAPLLAAHAYGDAAAAIERDRALSQLPESDRLEVARTSREALSGAALSWYAGQLAFLDERLASIATPEDLGPLRERVEAIPTHGLRALETARDAALERLERARREVERAREEATRRATLALEAALADAHGALERGELERAVSLHAALVVPPEARADALRDTRFVDLGRVATVEAAWRAHVAGLAARVADTDKVEIELRDRVVAGRLERVDVVKGQLVVRRRVGAIEVGEAIAFSAIAPRQKAQWATASKADGVDALAMGLYLFRAGDPKAARVQLARAPTGDDRERYVALLDKPAPLRPPDKPEPPAAERAPHTPPLPSDPSTAGPGRSVRVRYDLAKPDPGWAELAFRRRAPSAGCPGGAYCRPEPGVGLRVRNGVLRWRAPHGAIDRASMWLTIVPGDGRVALRLGGRSIVLPTRHGGASHLERELGQAIGAREGWWRNLSEPRWITLEATPEPRPRLTRVLVGEEELHLVDAAGAERWELVGGQSSFELDVQGDLECVVRSVWIVARWSRETLAELKKRREHARRCVRPAKLDELCPFKDDDDINTRWDNSDRGWFPVPHPHGFDLMGRGHGKYLRAAKAYVRRSGGYYLARVRPGEQGHMAFVVWQEVRHENAQRGLILPTTAIAQDCEAWWRDLGDLEVWVDRIPQDWHQDNSYTLRWPPTEEGDRNITFEAELGATAIERVAIGALD